MPNSRIDLTLGIRADIAQASQQIKSLQSQLDSLSKISTIDNQYFSKDLIEASNAALQLKQNIEGAFNVNTGKLDLSKFNQSLKQSGMDLQKYQNILYKIGPDGEKAFNELATAIQYAEIPLKRANGLLTKFFDGLKNTAMWTLQSNAIHAVQGALSSAYGYAQQLNKGLTDIAIVSDLNTQQLTEFAKTANQMAKDLSASTNDVVSGALIYYQAGLSDEEVIKRTETTIKLAQTSGETSEQISSYMTAIWNNFYDGSKSVEYYADAISYLGAVTAASNADIAEGLQSFAATADTIGLSFEYAASAMTIIRDVTQQSASTIGNSLKTIFARLEGLKLGETLEDGVDLNKYSKALQAVGVEILETNGELKDADTILDELAKKWETLGEAERVALAQTVGGVRQYNSLITLMDHYEDFQDLVTGAKNSTGYLNNQQEEYAQSWEAAMNRAKAAWQDFYDAIIEDKFFITLKNIEAGFASLLATIVKGVGGMGGAISTVGAILFSVFGDKLADSLRNFSYNLGFGREELKKLQEEASKKQIDQLNNSAFGQNTLYADNVQTYKEKLESFNNLKDQMTETERTFYQGLLDTGRGLIEQAKAAGEAATQFEKLAKSKEEGIVATYAGKVGVDNDEANSKFGGTIQNYKDSLNNFYSASISKNSLLGIFNNQDNELNPAQQIQELQARLQDLDGALKGQGLPTFSQNFKDLANEIKTASAETLPDLKQKIESTLNETTLQSNMEGLQKELIQLGIEVGIDEEKMVAFVSALDNHTGSQHESAGAILQTIDYLRALHPELTKATDGFTQAMAAAQTATRLISGIKSIESLFKNLASGSIDAGQALSSMATTALMLIPVFKAIQKEAQTTGLLLGTKIGIAIAVIYALYAAWKFLSDYLEQKRYNNSAQKLLDDANESLREQTELVDKLNTKYEETNSTIDKLRNTKDTFKDLKTNTVEWTEAVQQNNEAALDLLDSYGLLGKRSKEELYDIKDGLIEIHDEVLDEIQQIAQAQLSNARLGKYAAKNAVNNANIAAGQEKLDEKFSSAIDDYEKNRTENSTIAGPTDAGKRNYDFNEAERSGKDLIDEIINHFNSSLPDFLKNANPDEWGDWIDLINSNTELKDAINEQILTVQNNTAAMEARNEQIGADLLDQMGYTGPAYAKNYVEQQLGSEYNEQREKTYNELDEKSNEDIWGNEQYKDLLTNLGYTYSKAEDKFYKDGEQFGGNIRDVLASEIVRVAIVQDDTKDDAIAEEYAKTDEGKQAEEDWMEGEAERQQRSSLEWANEEVTEAGFENDEKFESLKESVKAAADEIDRLSENVKEDEVALIQVAKAVEQSERGYAELAKNWESWKEALETGLDEGNIEAYTEALTGTVDALADVMNISDELTEANMQLGDTFRDYVAENLDVVQRAVEGDTDAILELQEVATEDIVGQLAEKNTDALGLTADRIAEIQSMVGSAWDDIRAQLESGDIKVGSNIDDGPLMQKLTDIINSVAMTSQEAQLLLSQMGFEAEVEEDDKVYRKTDQYLIPAQYSQGPTLRYGLEGSFFTVQQDSPATYEPVESEEVQPVHALRIKTAKYVGGGNITTKKGGNGKGTGGNGKGKGGGGGEKKITPKSKDASRYHEIKSQLEQTKHYLDMIEMAEGRAYGQKKLDLIDQKIELLKQEAEQYGELYKEAKKYYDEDKEVLNSQYGAAFNADGSIKDYDSWYGHFVDMYNSGKMSDDEWKKFEDAIKKYEQSLKEMNDAEKKTQEDLNKVYDAKLEKVEYRLKTVTDLIKMDMEYLDYMLEMLDDDGLDTAEAIAYLSKEIDDITKKYDANKEALAGIFKNHEGVTDDIINQLYSGQLSVEDFIKTIGDFTQKEIDTIQNIMSSMFENGKDLKKYIEELYKKLDELSDKFQEAIDKQIDKLDHFNKMIEKTKNIIDVMGKDTLGISDELLNRMQRSQIEIGKEHIATLQQEIDQYRVWIQELEQQYAVMNPEDLEAKNLKKIIDSYKEVYDGLKEDLLDTTADVGEEIKKYWREIIDQTVEYAGNAISGAIGDFEKMLDMYDKQKKIDDLYLDTYKKTYETNKLLRDINKSINDTDNIKGQKALRDLQKEILGYQDEGVQLTEYQIEERRKYYDLLLAEIALEEAQNAKSQVRMTRDNEGNWSYTYTTDQEQVDNLQQNYDDKLFAYEDFNNKTLEGALDTYNQLTQDWLGALSEAATAEEVALINNYYTPMIQAAGQTVDYIMGRNNELTQNFDVNNNEIATSLADTAYGAVTNYETIGEAMDALDVAIGEATESIIGSLQSMDEEQLALAESVGVTEPQVEELINNARDAVDEVHVAVAGDGTDEHPGIAKDFDDEFNGALNTLSAFYTKSGPIINNIINEVGKITHKVNEVIDAYSRLNNTPIVTPDLSGPIGAFRRLEAAANAAAAAAAAAASAGAGVGGGGGNSGVETHGASKGGGGCFKAGTKITMADGSYKNIEEIQVGDNIISYDELTKEFKTDIVTNIFIHSNIKTIVKIYLSNNNILYTTPNHPLLSTKGWKSLDIIGALFIHGVFTTIMKNNDELIGINKNLKIINIEQNNNLDNIPMYNLSTKNYHTYLVDNLIAHNKIATQEMLAVDTGGLMDAWGPEGKIAMLHEKELVLNKQDTVNMLQTVEFVRDLVQMIGANASVNSLNDLFASKVSPGGNHLDQNVTIHAEFPNAVDHSEIEEAFQNLIGLAGQYAGRKQ